GITDGRARGNAPRRPRTASGESERHYCELCRTGRSMEKRGRENDTWGPRVSSNFPLISNFWIVTPPLPRRTPSPRSHPLLSLLHAIPTREARFAAPPGSHPVVLPF